MINTKNSSITDTTLDRDFGPTHYRPYLDGKYQEIVKAAAAKNSQSVGEWLENAIRFKICFDLQMEEITKAQSIGS